MTPPAPAPDELRVVVAAWGPGFGYPHFSVFNGEQFADQPPELPYEERSKVTLEVEPATTLGAVVDRAASEFGVLSADGRAISEQVHWVSFRRADDDRGTSFEYDRWYAAIRTVTPDGTASWPVAWADITLKELVATAEAGELDGDPLRPYFWPVIPQGELSDLASALWLTWSAWEHWLSARETLALVRKVRERIRGGREVATSNREAWHQWLRRPQILFPYLDSSPRLTPDIAVATGLSPKHIEPLMWAMGYARGTDGRWRRGGDAAATVLDGGLRDIQRLGQGPWDMERAAERVRGLVEAAEATGNQAGTTD